MDRQYWNSLAASFDEDLLEIAEAGSGTVLQDELAAVQGARKSAADLGCGPGSLLPELAARFAQVVGVDYAEELLEVAAKRCPATNVSFRRHDLSRGRKLPFEVEVVCCINALIDPDRKAREGMARSMVSALTAGGTALVVVPAFESVIHVYHALLRCRRRDGRPAGLSEGEANRLLGSEVDSFVGGVVRVGGIPTKYWMRDEILGALREEGLTPQRVRRVEYSWKEEIDHPPRWLEEESLPWDWMVVASKEADGGLKC